MTCPISHGGPRRKVGSYWKQAPLPAEGPEPLQSASISCNCVCQRTCVASDVCGSLRITCTFVTGLQRMQGSLSVSGTGLVTPSLAPQLPRFLKCPLGLEVLSQPPAHPGSRAGLLSCSPLPLAPGQRSTQPRCLQATRGQQPHLAQHQAALLCSPSLWTLQGSPRTKLPR